MIFIQGISIQLPKIDPSNLKISKLFNIFFFAVVFLVFLFFAISIDIFEKTLKCVLEGSCLYGKV